MTKATKLHEVSSLYRTFSPTFNAYTVDGAGRDTYIGYNNGGFWNNRIPPGTPYESTTSASNRYRIRNVPKQVAPFKYYSDGSGRDSYILINSGGLKREAKPLTNYHLKDFLRTPDSCILEYKPSSSSGRRHFVSKKEFEFNEQLRKNQRGIIERLYNRERHKFIPNWTDINTNNIKKMGKTTTDGFRKGKKLPHLEIGADFIYDVDKINRFERIKKIKKAMTPVNNYLHYKNENTDYRSQTQI
jgi:hypothetical protein